MTLLSTLVFGGLKRGDGDAVSHAEPVHGG